MIKEIEKDAEVLDVSSFNLSRLTFGIVRKGINWGCGERYNLRNPETFNSI